MRHNKLWLKSEALIIKLITNSVYKKSPIKNENYRNNVKYTIADYIKGISSVLKSGGSWNLYSGTIPGDTLRKKNTEWSNLGVYEDAHKSLLKMYFKKFPICKELKYQSIDSTFVEDKNGSKYSKYSGIHKCRKGESSKGVKITTIVSTSGIPISVTINPANHYDSTLLPAALDNIVIDCNTKKYANNNRNKQYLLGDKGYDSKENHKILIDKGYTPVIAQNKRNIKNPALIRKMSMPLKKVYKKRIIIENYHSWIKKFGKIRVLQERNIKNYEGLLFLGITTIIARRVVTDKS